MPTIKYTREDITKLENERDQYKLQRDELSVKLDKECNVSLNIEGQLHDMSKQRDSLIKDVEKLREELKHLRIETDEYFELWQNEKLTSQGLREQCKEYAQDASKYTNLTEHIKDKALNNPSEHRYFRLVHFIDDLEADTHEGN